MGGEALTDQPGSLLPASIVQLTSAPAGKLSVTESPVAGVGLLLVSELTSNAVIHARGTICVTVQSDAHRVRIEVEDQGRGRPALRPTTQNQPDGRGLRVADKLATDWGTQRRQTLNVVWFEIAR